MKYRILYIATILLVFSCGKDNTKPEGVLNEDKMSEVITELELTQALIKLKFSSPDTLIDRQELYNQVFNDFNISQEQFNNSLSYYSKQPKVLEGIYIQVINQLSAKQAEMQ